MGPALLAELYPDSVVMPSAFLFDVWSTAIVWIFSNFAIEPRPVDPSSSESMMSVAANFFSSLKYSFLVSSLPSQVGSPFVA